MHNKIITGDEARKIVYRGVKKVADAVSVTFGAKGRSVAIQKAFGMPHITKDGVTVAKGIKLKDNMERIGADMIRESAQRTNDEAGDGTTTATIISHAIIEAGLKAVNNDSNPVFLRRGIDAGKKDALELLSQLATPIENFEMIGNIATISANNDDNIGKILSSAFERAGEDSVITVEASPTEDTFFDMVDGFTFDRGYISPLFVNVPDKESVEFSEVAILISDKAIISLNPLAKILEDCVKQQKSIVIIADDIESDALRSLLYNKIQGGLKVVAIKAPSFGNERYQLLKDIAITTGGKVISDKAGMNFEDVTMEDIGFCKKIQITKNSTTIVDGLGSEEDLNERVASIRAQMESATSEYDKERFQRRISRLVDGVGVVYVGGNSEVEMKERKDRVEDALNATQCAIEKGIIAGGGTTLYRIAERLSENNTGHDDFAIGYGIFLDSLKAPFRMILKNAGLSHEKIVNMLDFKNLESHDGIDLNDVNGDDTVIDLYERGIIDPVKVTERAIANSASVAGTFITMEVAISHEFDEEDQQLLDGMG